MCRFSPESRAGAGVYQVGAGVYHCIEAGVSLYRGHCIKAGVSVYQV